MKANLCKWLHTTGKGIKLHEVVTWKVYIYAVLSKEISLVRCYSNACYGNNDSSNQREPTVQNYFKP